MIPTNKIKTVCVFCGTDIGDREDYEQDARKLSCLMLDKDISLVYGGGKTGLMGVIADEYIKRGKVPIGILPKEYADESKNSCEKIILTNSRAERLKSMIQLSDGFIALPGSLGTFRELITVLYYIYRGIIHHKPCAILNSASFFDLLIDFLDNCVKEGFLSQEHRNILIIRDNPEDLIESFENYESDVTPKQWR